MDKTPLWPQIVFFDGFCILCNRSVDFLIRHDKRKKFKYASLQSDLAKDLIPGYLPDGRNIDTVLFLDQGKIWTRSDAVLKILGNLQFPFNTAIIFLVFPARLRNLIYDWIAHNRFRWFGMRENCRIPDKETKGLIIDS